MAIQFNGQQTDERVLYEITPHPFAKFLSLSKLFFLLALFDVMIVVISSVIPVAALLVLIGGISISLLIFLIGFWWINTVYTNSRTYITDRRIMRFEVATPFVTTKRALFWNEALKAKAYSPGFLQRLAGIGTVEVEPHLSTTESVRVSEVGFYDDLANYIDKILFTFKNKPAEISALHPFVPKPRGHRD